VADITREDDPRTLAAKPVGTVVSVAETQERLIAVGSIAPHIAAKLQWPRPNVWLPEHARSFILGRHPVFPDVIAAARSVLTAPLGVYLSDRRVNTVLILGDADLLRQRDLLPSKSAPFVDAIIERRSVAGGFYLRLYHLSPATRNKGGLRLWP
jgi:hypothetical protein